MADLVLGPVLRHVGQHDATVWVETDRPCTVGILGAHARTFTICGRCYALVRVGGLAPGTTRPYSVELDGELVWPQPGSRFPPSVIRTLTPGGPARLLVGSCRVARPHTLPYVLAPDRHEEGLGVDALAAFAEHLRHEGPGDLPDLVVHLGDQVYSDRPPAPVLDFVQGRRAAVPGPPDEVVDYEEFARLYVDAWSEPALRWLLSTVPNVMMFDDHDVHDDWNTSLAWRRERARIPWWHERMIAALMTYWVYQHVGNLDQVAGAEEGVLERLEHQRGDATAVLREFAEQADLHPESVRWSCHRDLGCARLVVVDSRAGRVLEPGRRDMLDGAHWSWLEAQLTGGPEHVLFASTLPVLLPPALHELEAWNERLCDGAFGGLAAGWSEALRQRLDLEHWAAFQGGFQQCVLLLTSLADGERGPAPSSVCLLGGDVHLGYVAEVRRPPGTTPIYQVVSSPLRNKLEPDLERIMRVGLSPAMRLVTWPLARTARTPRPPIHWRITHGPWFDNHLVDLTLRPGRADLALHEAQAGHHPDLRTRLLLRLSPRTS
jgi:hypothetical protein